MDWKSTCLPLGVPQSRPRKEVCLWFSLTEPQCHLLCPAALLPLLHAQQWQPGWEGWNLERKWSLLWSTHKHSIKNSLPTSPFFIIQYNKSPFKRNQTHYVPFLSRCSMLAPRAMRTDTSSSCPPAHASVSAVSWLLSVCGQKNPKNLLKG